MTVPVREQGNRSRKVVGESRGGGEGVGVTKEVMNGEGFRAGDGRGKMVYCEGSELYIRKKAELPSQAHASHYQYEVLLYMSLTVQQNSDKLSLKHQSKNQKVSSAWTNASHLHAHTLPGPLQMVTSYIPHPCR